MKVGFIGLGIMGSRMAANLQKHGHELVVYNRTRAKAEPLIGAGAGWAATPAEMAPQVETLITMLGDPGAVENAALGQDGFLPQMKADALWVDCTTVHPAFSRRMAAASLERGLRFLDAPVAGTRQPAETGELVFFAGGAAEDVETCGPLFQAMGKATKHVGGHGMGASLKMVFNLMLGASMVAFSEGMVLGEALGISPEVLFESLLGGPVAPPFLMSKKDKMQSGAFEPDFSLKWLHKDLHLVATSAFERGVPSPLANAAKETFALANQAGLGEQDFSAVYGFLRGPIQKRK